jgi:hypothetical protein
MAGLLELERLCTALPGQIDVAVNDLARRVVRVIDVDLVEHTPVDVTTAVSNWQPGINSAPDFELPAISPGSGGSTAPASRAEAIAHVERALADKKPGEAFFLTNVTPYIGDLNDGTSKQEPAGFVERAVRIGESFAARAQLEFGR